MRIGFDAKRAFNNQSGLGNYSRNLLSSLALSFPGYSYFLYTPSLSNRLFSYQDHNFAIRKPEKSLHKAFPWWWRSFRLSAELSKDKLDVYHGLSHELPPGIKKTGIKTVVTIHDLIFIRYPELYSPVDRIIYNRKFRYACIKADKIIAVSNQTADDIIRYYHIDPSKIEVIYQACNPLFMKSVDEETKLQIRHKYKLPDNYILHVGNIEERKNALMLIKAVHIAKIDRPLVIIGRKTKYFKQIQQYIDDQQLKNILFLDTIKNEELPSFYRMADLFIYPSLFEGFGIPIIESLFSGTPVITSRGGCFPEAGGSGTIYIDPHNVEELSDSIKKVLSDSVLRNRMIESGYRHAAKFTPEKAAEKVVRVYESLFSS